MSCVLISFDISITQLFISLFRYIKLRKRKKDIKIQSANGVVCELWSKPERNRFPELYEIKIVSRTLNFYFSFMELASLYVVVPFLMPPKVLKIDQIFCALKIFFYLFHHFITSILITFFILHSREKNLLSCSQ